MIDNILLYISSGFIICAFIGYLFLIMIGRGKIVAKSNGFDITKDIISEYNSINVIESKRYFTIYNIKRRVIKLSTRCYYGSDLSSVSLSLMEAGISVIDNQKNKYIDLFRKIFSNLKILYIFPFIAILINNASYNISDAKVSIIFLGLFSVISYMIIDIKSQASEWISNNIKKIKEVSKDNSLKIVSFINRLLWLDKFIFFGELIMIIRFVMIMLEIS